MSDNPYVMGQVVQDPALFFGRQEEIAILREEAQKGNNKSVIALRRMGKSSLLYQLCHHHPHPDTLHPIYLDLHDERLKTVAGFYGAILQPLADRLHLPMPAALAQSGVFNEAIERFNQRGLRPLICLDEVEKMMAYACFDNAFFENLRHLGSHQKVTFLTASLNPLQEVVVHNGQTSMFYNIFTPLHLAGLTDAAARELLTTPFRRRRAQDPAAPPPPNESQIALALQLAGHHPYFLQMAGSVLWRTPQSTPAQFREQFAPLAEDALLQLWRGLTAVEQTAVAKLCTHTPCDPFQQNLLRRRGLLEGERLFSDLLSELWHNQRLAPKATAPIAPALPLHRRIAQAFNPSELDLLCADLDIDPDELASKTHPNQAAELVKWVRRRGKMPDLLQALRRERPHQPWEEL